MGQHWGVSVGLGAGGGGFCPQEGATEPGAGSCRLPWQGWVGPMSQLNCDFQAVCLQALQV